jgi:hypothetical protein
MWCATAAPLRQESNAGDLSPFNLLPDRGAGKVTWSWSNESAIRVAWGSRCQEPFLRRVS